MESRELICIGCPMGCMMTVTLEDGRVGDYIAGNYRGIESETKREMDYGELTYLQFALSYNTDAKAELYSADGSSLI